MMKYLKGMAKAFAMTADRGYVQLLCEGWACKCTLKHAHIKPRIM